MMDSSMRVCQPTMHAWEVIEQFSKWAEENEGIKGSYWNMMTYCSWPEVFASTAGPFGGIGGQAMTTFRMEAWVWHDWAVVFCKGRIVRIGRFQIQAEWRN